MTSPAVRAAPGSSLPCSGGEQRMLKITASPTDGLSTDHGPVDEPLTRFVGCEAYGVGSLRDDLARFTFLLGESDGEGLFSPRTPS
jgi:hypothetical protein